MRGVLSDASSSHGAPPHRNYSGLRTGANSIKGWDVDDEDDEMLGPVRTGWVGESVEEEEGGVAQ